MKKNKGYKILRKRDKIEPPEERKLSAFYNDVLKRSPLAVYSGDRIVEFILDLNSSSFFHTSRPSLSSGTFEIEETDDDSIVLGGRIKNTTLPWKVVIDKDPLKEGRLLVIIILDNIAFRNNFIYLSERANLKARQRKALLEKIYDN